MADIPAPTPNPPPTDPPLPPLTPTPAGIGDDAFGFAEEAERQQDA